MIADVFRATLTTHQLVRPADRVLVGVSGGGDSVALLRLLADHAQLFSLALIVAHVNHRVRGAAADEDQRFVEALVAGLGLRCLSLVADRGPLAPSEEVLRKARHALLARAAEAEGCSRIALGHTMDDQAETVLMRLLRGAGRRGLSAMAVSGPGRLIRPMLGITRAEARSYLASLGQPCREDETNRSPRFLRNRIRQEVLPVLIRINPSIVGVLARTAELLGEEDRLLDRLAEEWLSARALPGSDAASTEVVVPAEQLSELSPALSRRVVRLMLRAAGGDPRGAASSAVREALDLAARGRDGDVRGLAGGMSARLHGQGLMVRSGRGGTPQACEPFSLALEIPGSVDLPCLGAVLTARVVARESIHFPPGGREGPDLRRRAWVDADVLGDRAVVRSRMSGDRFHPLGGPGSRKVKDLLIDRKVPRRLRDRVALVVGPQGIAWIVGQGIGHPYRLTEHTRRVVEMEYLERQSAVDVGGP